MVKETPNLSEMGVRNPEQIIGYTLVQVSEDRDVLKINYRRPQNSFLPKRRSYEFKRTGKPMPGSELRGSEVFRYDISPLLGRAITELDALLNDSKTTAATKQQLQDELNELGREINERMAHLSKLIDTFE